MLFVYRGRRNYKVHVAWISIGYSRRPFPQTRCRTPKAAPPLGSKTGWCPSPCFGDTPPPLRLLSGQPLASPSIRLQSTAPSRPAVSFPGRSSWWDSTARSPCSLLAATVREDPLRTPDPPTTEGGHAGKSARPARCPAKLGAQVTMAGLCRWGGRK